MSASALLASGRLIAHHDGRHMIATRFVDIIAMWSKSSLQVSVYRRGGVCNELIEARVYMQSIQARVDPQISNPP